MVLPLAALLMLAADGLPHQFDLHCRGGIRHAWLDPYRPYDETLRVDLDRRLWCQGDCKLLRPIADVQPSLIVFSRESETEKALRQSNSMLVSREDGRLLALVDRGGRAITNIDARCEAAPFSGFPEVKTRF